MGVLIVLAGLLIVGSTLAYGGVWIGHHWRRLSAKRWEKKLLKGIENIEHQEAVALATEELEEEMEAW